jgi:RNA polymerase sigma factor (TIGR02999 family)
MNIHAGIEGRTKLAKTSDRHHSFPAIMRAVEDAASSGMATRVLIARWRQGDAAAADELTRLVYGNLRRLASSYMRSEREGHTLSPTGLVHEAYIRLSAGDLSIQDRSHFLAMAAREMRRVLVEHARSRSREKRGGAGLQQVTLDEAHRISAGNQVDVLVVEEAMERLSAVDARKARLVDLICFGGLSADEAAVVLEVSPATVRRDWIMARAWLQHELAAAPKSAVI